MFKAQDGRTAIELAKWTEPDVIAWMFSMPQLDGVRFRGKMQALDIDAQIIILSMYYNSVSVQQARENGVVGYVLKQEANRVLVLPMRLP